VFLKSCEDATFLFAVLICFVFKKYFLYCCNFTSFLVVFVECVLKSHGTLVVFLSDSISSPFLVSHLTHVYTTPRPSTKDSEKNRVPSNNPMSMS